MLNVIFIFLKIILIFYLSESFYYKYNLYIDKIKNYLINKNIIKEHIKEYIKKNVTSLRVYIKCGSLNKNIKLKTQ